MNSLRGDSPHFKIMQNLLKISNGAKKEKGTILIIAFLVLGILLFLGTYFLTFTLTELRITKSQEIGTRTYYLAESGINEAIWKLKHDNTTLDGDPAWATEFITSPGCATWQASFIRQETLFSGGSYSVSIRNLECARGVVTATSTISLPGGRFSQRVVRATVYRAIGSPIENSGLFSGGTGENIIIDNSSIRINQGNIFSNNNLIIRNRAILEAFNNPNTAELEGQTLAVRNILISDSTVTSTTRCAANVCTPNCLKCPPNRITMPAIDFDSAANPNSLKNRARVAQNNLQCQVLCNNVLCSNRCIFTELDFRLLTLWAEAMGGTLTLNNAITYVEGEIELRGGLGGGELIVNGILAADRDIEIGRDRWGWRQGHITVNPSSGGGPSGLLTKRRVYLERYVGFLNRAINIQGVIYSLGDTKIEEVPERINVVGGILFNSLKVDGLAKGLEITVDNRIINQVLLLTQPPGGGAPIFYSPVISIGHWEEVL